MLATFAANRIVEQLLQQTSAAAKSNIKIKKAVPTHSLFSVIATQQELNMQLQFLPFPAKIAIEA